MRAKFWLESLKGRDHSENLSVAGRIILKWILGKLGLGVLIGFIWLRIKRIVGSCEHFNEPLGSIKGGEFPD
jgi:hypothetical protein